MNVVEQQSVTLILCQQTDNCQSLLFERTHGIDVAINSLLCQVKLQFVKKEYVILTVVQISYISSLISCQLSTCHLSRKIAQSTIKIRIFHIK